MLLAVLSAFLLQDAGAEEAFRKIEERALQSPALSLDLELQRTTDTLRKTVLETMVIGDGNRFRFTLRKKASDLVVASDGHRIRVKSTEGDREVDVPETLKQDVTRTWVRFGGAGMIFYLGALLTRPETSPPLDVASMFVVSQVQPAPDEGDAKSLTYMFAYNLLDGVGKKSFRVQVTYDPKTFAIRKRTWTGEVLDEQVATTETYREYAFYQAIPADQFG